MFLRLTFPSLAAFLLSVGACSEGHKRDGDAPVDHASGMARSEPNAVATRDCAKRPGKLRGKSNQTLAVGPLMRSFVYYVPESLDSTEPVPLVIAAHGFAMSGETMYKVTGFKELADREGFAVAFPDGASFGSPWNAGPNITGVSSSLNGAADDQGFLDAIQTFVDQDLCLDRAHVFVSGFSMGGYFASETGCVRDDLAGIAPHSGGTHDLSDCPGSIKPVILFHGEADGVVAYAGNAVLARDRWRERNGCSAEFDAEQVQGGGTCEYYQDCPEHAQVALCHFAGLEHKWAGGNDPSYWYGDPDRANAAELAWGFWTKYAW